MPQSSTVTIRLEEFGQRSLPNTHIVYTRIGKEFVLGKTRFEVNADVHNLFNANTPTSVTFASGPLSDNSTRRHKPAGRRFSQTDANWGSACGILYA